MEKLGRVVEKVEKRGAKARIRAKRRKEEMRGESLLFIGWKAALAIGRQPNPRALAIAMLDHKNLDLDHAHMLNQTSLKVGSRVWVQGY